MEQSTNNSISKITLDKKTLLTILAKHTIPHITDWYDQSMYTARTHHGTYYVQSQAVYAKGVLFNQETHTYNPYGSTVNVSPQMGARCSLHTS